MPGEMILSLKRRTAYFADKLALHVLLVKSFSAISRLPVKYFKFLLLPDVLSCAGRGSLCEIMNDSYSNELIKLKIKLTFPGSKRRILGKQTAWNHLMRTSIWIIESVCRSCVELFSRLATHLISPAFGLDFFSFGAFFFFLFLGAAVVGWVLITWDCCIGWWIIFAMDVDGIKFKLWDVWPYNEMFSFIVFQLVA